MINIIFTVLLASGQMLASTDSIQTMILAENYMKNGQTELAIETFNKALASGELNDFAKISIYWNLHVAYDSLKNYDAAGESLMSFILNGDGLIEYLEEINRPEHPGHIFVSQIDLKNKILYSKVLLEIYWYKHNPSNCKTKESACVLPIKQLYGLYAMKLPFCGDAHKIKNVQKLEDNPIHLKVECEDKDEEYYFQ